MESLHFMADTTQLLRSSSFEMQRDEPYEVKLKPGNTTGSRHLKKFHKCFMKVWLRLAFNRISAEILGRKLVHLD